MCMLNLMACKAVAAVIDPQVVHLVETGFTLDLFLRVALAKKREQHALLCSMYYTYYVTVISMVPWIPLNS